MKQIDRQAGQKTASVLGRGRVRIIGEPAPALYFGGTRGKEPGMWWRFWEAWCGPYKAGPRRGEYRKLICRCPIHLPVGRRLMQGRSISASGRRALKRCAFVRPATPEVVAHWKKTHRSEWSRIKFDKMTPKQSKWAKSCR